MLHQVRANTRQTSLHNYFNRRKPCKTQENIFQIHLWILPSFLLHLCSRYWEMVMLGILPPWILGKWRVTSCFWLLALGSDSSHTNWCAVLIVWINYWFMSHFYLTSLYFQKNKIKVIFFGNPEDGSSKGTEEQRLTGSRLSFSPQLLYLPPAPWITWKKLLKTSEIC